MRSRSNSANRSTSAFFRAVKSANSAMLAICVESSLEESLDRRRDLEKVRLGGIPIMLRITVWISSLDLDQVNVIYAVVMNWQYRDRVMIYDIYVFYSTDYVIDPSHEI
jgi:hypothetical protein